MINTPLQLERDQAIAQLKTLGYQDGETVYLRSFPPKLKGKKGYAANSECQFPNLPEQQGSEVGLYVVANGSGHRDADVQLGRVLFCEFDDRPIEDQLQFWQDKGLPEPSLQVRTRKSVHSYWTLTEPCSIADWKQLLADLLEFVDGDRTLKNPSRVMRLAGSWHIKAGEEPIKCDIVSNSGNRFAYQELRQLIPQRQVKKRQELPTPKPQQVTTSGSGQSQSLKELLEREIYPRLSPEQIYNWSGHDWQPDRSKNKLRGCCPWHDSQSGTAFYTDYRDGTWLWLCPACGIGGSAIEYRWALKGGSGSPLGKDFVEVVKELAHDAGVQMPEYRAFTIRADRLGNDGEQLHQQNQWYTPKSHNFEIGKWRRVKGAVYQHEADIPENFKSPNHQAMRATIEIRETNDDGSMGAKREVEGFMILEFEPQADFDFHVERVLESSDGGGLALRISRLRAGRLSTKRIIVNSTDCTSIKDFQDAVKKGLGTGVSCKLRPDDLQDLLHDRIEKYHQKGGRIYRLIDRVGQQADGTWVFENCQFTSQGKATTEDASGWVWNPRLGIEDFMPSPKIVEQDPLALKRLVDAQRRFFGANFRPALIVMGWAVASLHYQEIIARDGSFPIANLIGDPGTNKTIAGENALSLVGWPRLGMLSRVTASALYERLKLSGSLPSCWDDPERTPELDETLKGLYNAKPRVVRGNAQQPHGGMMVTSNHACGDEHPATKSRLIQIEFSRITDGDKEAWRDLQEAQALASGALSSLIKLGYASDEIRVLEDELIRHLPYAHSRIARSLALVTYYAMKVAELAGAPEDIKAYALSTLCPSANDPDSVGDSLTDFLSKLNALQADALVGEWNVRTIRDEQDNPKSVAIYLANVWPLLDKCFKPSYSQKIIKSHIEKVGGKSRTAQKFHKNRDESLTYYRSLLNPRTDRDGNALLPTKPEMVNRCCIEIPASVAADFIASFKTPEPPIDPDNNPVIRVITSNQKTDYRQNTDSTRAEAPLDTPVIKVIIKSKEREREREEPHTPEVKSTPPEENGQVSKNSDYRDYQVARKAESQPQQEIQPVISFADGLITGDYSDYSESGCKNEPGSECAGRDPFEGCPCPGQLADDLHPAIGSSVTVLATGRYQGQAGKVLEYDPDEGVYRIELEEGGEGWWKPEFIQADFGVNYGTG